MGPHYWLLNQGVRPYRWQHKRTTPPEENPVNTASIWQARSAERQLSFGDLILAIAGRGLTEHNPTRWGG
jgi:hypothetical protein